MSQRPSIYDALAALLAYPRDDYAQRLAAAVEAAGDDVRKPLAAFADAVRPFTTEQLQELFIQTFDLNPVCSLELGWHLFGENYERGLLLVRMRQELRRHGLAESTELPDHLTHVLLLLGRMEREAAEDFAAACVLPALAKMLPAFTGKQNPFEYLMDAVARLLAAEFPHVQLAPPDQPALRVLA